MLYYLAQQFTPAFGFLNVFNYHTVRAGGALVTGFLFCLIVGPKMISMLRDLKIGQHIKKDHVADLNPIAACQSNSVADALTIDNGSVSASQIFNIVATLGTDHSGVLTRDQLVPKNQVASFMASEQHRISEQLLHMFRIRSV